MGRKRKERKVAEETIVVSDLGMQKKSVGLSLRKTANATVRRSGRIQNLTPPAQNQENNPVAEEVHLSESEKEEEPRVEENPAESMPTQRSLEEKIDYLVEAVKELKSEATGRPIWSDNACADLRYKSMYIDSQKKIEALSHENCELSRKLGVVLGKIKAVGEANCVCSKMLKDLKDVFFTSDLRKSTENAMNRSYEAMLGKFSARDDIAEPSNAPAANRNKCRIGSRNN